MLTILHNKNSMQHITIQTTELAILCPSADVIEPAVFHAAVVFWSAHVTCMHCWMQDAAQALHRAVREAETAAEEQVAITARQAKRETDFLQSELADAAAAHEALLKV